MYKNPLKGDFLLCVNTRKNKINEKFIHKNFFIRNFIQRLAV